MFQKDQSKRIDPKVLKNPKEWRKNLVCLHLLLSLCFRSSKHTRKLIAVDPTQKLLDFFLFVFLFYSSSMEKTKFNFMFSDKQTWWCSIWWPIFLIIDKNESKMTCLLLEKRIVHFFFIKCHCTLADCLTSVHVLGKPMIQLIFYKMNHKTSRQWYCDRSNILQSDVDHRMMYVF